MDREKKVDKASVITFADYEKLVMKLEAEQNFEDIESQNPKALERRKREQKDQIEARLVEFVQEKGLWLK